MAARRSPMALVIGLSLAGHAFLLSVLALNLARSPAEDEPEAQTIIPIFVLPPRSAGPSDGKSPRRLVETRVSPPPLAERASGPTLLPDVGGNEAAAEDLPAGVRAVLRSRLGCGRPEMLDRAARELCEQRLAQGAKGAPRLPLDVDPVMVAYYDAVAQAKAPDGPPTPTRAAGRLGLFETDGRGMKGRPPAVGCSIKFGAGKKPPGRPNSLRLGPCFISPPVGSLTRDAHIAHPDEVED